MTSRDDRPIDIVRKFDDPDFNDLPSGAKSHQNRHPKSPPKGSTADEESLRPPGVIDDETPREYRKISQSELDKMPNPDELING